ncbi:MAG TPA: FAD-dependent monooxygenase, partial [Capillimicrobium sp.]
MTPDVPVLVVGAGPTGLLLSSELRRRGVGCRLIDAAPEPLAWDRATVVHPRSLEIFESLGLLDAFLEAGVRQRSARLHSAGAALGAIDLALCGSRHAFNLGVSEQVTEAILTDHLRRCGGEVERGARLVSLEPRAGGVEAEIERDGGRERLLAGWVVGCDGLHSATREAAGVELAGHDLPDPWAVVDLTLEGWPETYEANFVYLDEVPVVLTALPGRRWRAYLRPTSPEADLVAEAMATVSRYQPAVRATDVADAARFHCNTRVATRYRAGRVLLAGDAAHVCSPAQGHGMNSGVGDAFNLGWKLALVAAGDAGPGLLDSYEAERRPVAEAITRSGDDAEALQAAMGPAERATRDAALRAVLADPDGSHHEAVAEAELDIDYGGSPIVRGAPAAG